VPEVGVEPTRF